MAGDDALAEWIGEAGAKGLSRGGGFRRADAVHGVRDRAVAGAPTEVPFERMREICSLLIVERRHGHDHAGRAEAALETLRIEKSLLHRMQVARLAESLDRRHRTARRAEGRNQAGVHGLAVEPDRAGAAVASVATLLHPKGALIPEEGPEALPGKRLHGKGPAVNRETGGGGIAVVHARSPLR